MMYYYIWFHLALSYQTAPLDNTLIELQGIKLIIANVIRVKAHPT